MSDAATTIVTGLPRSGTSLMMQMLDAGGLPPLTDHRRTADEDNPRGYYELDAVKRTRDDASWLEDARGRAVKMIHVLMYDLPQDRPYRVILMRRDLEEVTASQAVMLARRGTKGADLAPEALVAAYREQLERFEAWLDECERVSVLRVSYNELIDDPASVVPRVAAFLGGDLDTDAMHGAVDPQLYRQRSGDGGAPGVAAFALALLIAWAVSAWLGSGDGEVAGSVQHAYIGPGAGIALLGSFFAVLSAFVSGLFFLLTYPVRLVWRTLRTRKVLSRAGAKRVVILGLDGLEPELTEQYMDEGLLPNLAALRERGTYTRLGTSCPPLSPVAWSSFATGSNPGKHNIYDFIGCGRADYRPMQSSVRVEEGARKLRLGRWVLPLSSSSVRGLRRSKPFWKVLGEAGIFSSVIRVPITFPPDRFYGVQLSAMCVPDLRGTHGLFSFYTESEAASEASEAQVGGDVNTVEREGDTVRSFLRGPVNTLHRDRPEMRVPFRVERRADGKIVLHLQRERIVLEENKYSDWVRVSFRALGFIKIRGLCRFLLKSFDEPFALYCTPIQIDPDKPIMPIGHPRQYSRYLSRLLGSFATLGLAEDTWALSEGRLDEDDFLNQAYDIHAERERMYFDALKRVRRGLVTCVFDAPDRIQHMFWRFIDEDHPAHENGAKAVHHGVIRDMYRRMDDLVGRTVAALDDRTALFVMSDHGFKTFRRCVDLNAWLLEHGYLVLNEGARVSDRAYLADVDWTKTRAFGLGLAGIFLNRAGREAEGIVSDDDAPKLVAELAARLTGLCDSDSGAVAIHEAMPSGTVYSGPYVDEAPDIVIGYSVGYRVSWDSVIGKTAPAVFSDNTKAWSGDHCVHPDLVPGVLFSSRRLDGHAGAPRIVDLAPTTLELFGVPTPAYMDGTSLKCAAG